MVRLHVPGCQLGLAQSSALTAFGNKEPTHLSDRTLRLRGPDTGSPTTEQLRPQQRSHTAPCCTLPTLETRGPGLVCDVGTRALCVRTWHQDTQQSEPQRGLGPPRAGASRPLQRHQQVLSSARHQAQGPSRAACDVSTTQAHTAASCEGTPSISQKAITVNSRV